MLDNVDVCLSYIYSRFLCDALSDSHLAQQGLSALSAEQVPARDAPGSSRKIAWWKAGTTVGFFQSTVIGVQGGLRQG